jgi:DNA replication protein DnaC
MKRLNVVDEEMLKYFQTRATKAMENIKRTRREDCPRCPDVHSEVALACTSRLDPDVETHGYEDGPMCRHVEGEKARKAEEEVERARMLRMQHAGVPDPEMVKAFAKIRVMPEPSRSWFGADQSLRQGAENLKQAAMHFTADPRLRQLIAIGGTGTGKSTSAAWIVASTLDNSHWLAARTVDDIERWKPVASLVYSVPLLVIDDLGTERQSESGWGVETLASLWVDRIDRGMRTVVTTNLNLPGLAARYGERLKSRLNRTDVVVVAAGTVDLRKYKRDYQQRIAGKEIP